MAIPDNRKTSVTALFVGVVKLRGPLVLPASRRQSLCFGAGPCRWIVTWTHRLRWLDVDDASRAPHTTNSTCLSRQSVADISCATIGSALQQDANSRSLSESRLLWRPHRGSRSRL